MSQMQLNLHNFAKQAAPIFAAPQRRVCLDTEVTDLRLKAKSLWFAEAPFFKTAEDLAAHVGHELGVNPSVVRAWRSLYEWTDPARLGRRTSSIRNWRIEEDDDPLVHAHDPLEDLYNTWRNDGHRKFVSKYVEATGYNSPSEVNLSEVQEILNRHPITLHDLSIGICQEPSIFPVYARAKGVIEPPHAKISIPLGNLMFNNDGFATFIMRHVQHLYYHRGITLRVLAVRLGVNWRDLWLFGVRFGYWRMPSAATLVEMDSFFNHRKG